MEKPDKLRKTRFAATTYTQIEWDLIMATMEQTGDYNYSEWSRKIIMQQVMQQVSQSKQEDK